MEKNYYKVGGHIFSIAAPSQTLEELNLSAYEPFKIDETIDGILFDVEIVESIEDEVIKPLIVDAPLSSSGMPQVDVFELEGGYLYNIIMPSSNQTNASIAINLDNHKVKVALCGNTLSKQLAFNNSIILSYISYGLEHNTLLLHASTVTLHGQAYLFLGKSGTGKSTHSRMWLEAFKPEAELLNDDHPIVRSFDDGTITVYGSPWSGKTPCYRNLSSPLGAIIRISRAESNSLEKLRPIRAFASITTSCSGVQWSKKLMDDKIRAIETIVKSSTGYVMHCLPNVGAAEVCYNEIKQQG